MKMERPKLRRINEGALVGGVCMGLAEHFNVDVVLVRVIFVVLILAGGPGLLLYILLWIFVPEKVENDNEKKIIKKTGGKQAPKQRV